MALCPEGFQQARTGGEQVEWPSIMSARYLSLTTTTDTRDAAEAVALAVLEPRLAACVQIDGPFESRYWWKDRLESATEWRCTIKLAAESFARAEAAIRAVHPYSVPQIIAMPIVAGSAGYLAWLDDVTRTGGSDIP